MVKTLEKDTAQKTYFAMAVHCHQPVYNFGWEIQKAYEKAYAPLVDKLLEYPSVKVTFHFSGGLIKWFSKNRPEYIEKLKALLNRGQVEFLGGGCYDPLLALLPERDRKGQLRMNNDIVFSELGAECKGAWLAERLWDPSIIDTLADSGIEYTIVDDQHLLNAGVAPEHLHRSFKVSSRENSIVLFPALTEFRYSIPFRPVSDTLSFMRNNSVFQQDGNCFFFADDGEKFGSWPHTERHVYRNGWLDTFFAELTASSDWLQSCTYSDLLFSAEDFSETVPGSSYPEMLKWSGGDFGNFSKKYAECGRMYERMLTVSDRLADLKQQKKFFPENSKLLERATDELYKSQAGCAYWHGVFAGIYQPHFRKSVYEHLLKSEGHMRSLDPAQSIFRPVKVTENGPGKEICIGGKYIKLCLDPAGGTVNELDHLDKGINFANVLTRRRESYHDNLNVSFLWRVNRARRAFKRGERPDMNELLGTSERGLKKHLIYDEHKRNCFLTHIARDGFDWDGFSHSAQGENDFLSGEYLSHITEDGSAAEVTFTKKGTIFLKDQDPAELEIEKKIHLAGHSSLMGFGHRIAVLSPSPASFTWAVEFNFSVFDEKLSRSPNRIRAEELSVKDQWSGTEVKCVLNGSYDIYTYPVYTVNQTEKGLKKTLQGLAMLIGGVYDDNQKTGMIELDMTLLIR